LKTVPDLDPLEVADYINREVDRRTQDMTVDEQLVVVDMIHAATSTKLRFLQRAKAQT